MRNLTDQLHDFIMDAPGPLPKKRLSVVEERIFRSMKTQGERATKGRQVSKTIFEAKVKHGVSFLMIMEGRHSMSVAAQVVRRFDGANEIESAEVVKTKKGACVILCPSKENVI